MFFTEWKWCLKGENKKIRNCGLVNVKQKCPKLPVNKRMFEAHPFWVCPSKKHMEFLVNTIQGVACLHSKLKQDVRLHPPVC